jgi:ADP-ribosyl-[dinitrogen reductase] hydrolase
MVLDLESLHGCLLGGAIGDALGLPFERLSPTKIEKMLPAQGREGIEMCLLPKRGLFSDDTEHALFTARAVLESRGDKELFARVLHSEFRNWVYYLPAGIGLATLKAGVRAALFFPKTGVWSAGNGPAMRAAILGAFFNQTTEQLRDFCEISTALTHLDPKAKWGALAIALAASESSNGRHDSRRYVRELIEWSDSSPELLELLALVKKAANSAARGQTTRDFCKDIGLENGVSAYIYHTVPVVLQCWFRHGTNFRAALEEIILCGGDTDTTAAILGGIMGAEIGSSHLPLDWQEGLVDFPNSRSYIQRVAQEMGAARTEGIAVVTPRMLFGVPLLRNMVFAGILLVHVVRRALPV